MRKRNRNLIIFVLLILVALTGCGKKYMNLRGQVIDEETGEELAGVEVEVASKTVETNEDGYFQVDEIPVVDDVAKEDRRIKVNAEGYEEYSEPVALKEGDQSIDIELEQQYMKLSGQVIDRFQNSPLAGVKVELGDSIAETDANGYFEIEEIPVLAEEKTLKVAAPAYKTYAETVTIEPGSQDMKVKLEARQETKFFYSSDQHGSKDIYKTDIHGEKATRLTDDEADDWAPDWSSAREEILFLSNRDGNTNLYTMKADGTEQRQLTQTSTDKENPVWVDEDRVLFSSDRDGDYDLYIADVNGSYLKRLTDNDHYDGQAAYSAENNTVAYISETSGDKKLHVMDLESETKVLLNKSAGEDKAPAWSDQGAKILFTTVHEGQSSLQQIYENVSGLEEIASLDEEISDYAVWDTKNRLILYVSQGESQDLKLLTPNGEERDVLVKEDVNTADPAWEK